MFQLIDIINNITIYWYGWVNILYFNLFKVEPPQNIFITTNSKKYQKLLEFPTEFKFDPSYLNNVEFNSSPLIQHMHDFCVKHDVYKKGVIVSLSGGVDSMVTLAILIFLKKLNDFPIYTASIDYGLRPESNEETDFLIEYTKMFGIKSYVQYIKGISRKKEDSGSRSEFEEESRELRFNTYKQIIRENNLPLDTGVFVGHHQDDIIENIFTNSMKGGNLLDIEVMRDISIIHDVTIYRPFLSFKKKTIYEFSHMYNVPYFLDTTPKWSRRGKMRNEIFPLLDSVFGEDWKNKLKDLGSQSNQWGYFFSNHIIDPWYLETHIGPNGVIIPIKSFPKHIWSNIIMRCLHKSGQKMIKNTSLDKIMQTITVSKDNILVSLDSYRYAFKTNDSIIIFNSKYKLNTQTQNDLYLDLINGYVSKDLPKNITKVIMVV